MIVALLPFTQLLPAAGDAISVSGVILFYSSFLNTVELTLLSLFLVGHKPTRSYLANEAAMLRK